MIYFTRKFHTRIHTIIHTRIHTQIHTQIHTRNIQKLITEYNEKVRHLACTILALISHYITHFWTFEYQRKSMRNCTHSALYHSFLTIALISELFNNRVYKGTVLKSGLKNKGLAYPEGLGLASPVHIAG